MWHKVLLSLMVLTMGWSAIELTSAAEVVVERKALVEFPRSIGGMDAVEQPFSANVLDTLRLTDYLSRMYTERSDQQVIAQTGLYVGYYASQRTGKTYHSPKNCLPGSGWQMVDVGHTKISIGDGSDAQVNEIVIQKGLDKQVVVYWYYDRGRIIASEYLAKVYMVWDSATRRRTDGALVRVMVPVTDDVDAARAQARAFSGEILGKLPAYLPA